MPTVTRKTTVTAGGEKAEGSQTAEYVVYFLFGILEILLAFRLVFKLSGANPGSGFVNFIYSITQIFNMPFAGIFHRTTAPGAETIAVFEPSTLVAMVVYAILAWGVTQLILILSRRPIED